MVNLYSIAPRQNALPSEIKFQTLPACNVNEKTGHKADAKYQPVSSHKREKFRF